MVLEVEEEVSQTHFHDIMTFCLSVVLIFLLLKPLFLF